jgi:shikimate kinase
MGMVTSMKVMKGKNGNIYIIGFMCSGKTAVGRGLACKLGVNFIDTDEIIEKRVGCSISDLFLERGEGAFRDLETDILHELSALHGNVVSTGGGIIIRSENIDIMKSSGLLIWLDVTLEDVINRAGDRSNRPLLNVAAPEKQICKLLSARRPFYEMADIRINTHLRTVDNIVCDITASLEGK